MTSTGIQATDTVAFATGSVFKADGTVGQLAYEHLTGTPTAPTPSPGTNSTQVATTAFVVQAVSAALNGANNLYGGTVVYTP